MGYLLRKELETKLAKVLPEVDKGVVRVSVGIGPDHDGEDTLFFRVVLKDGPGLDAPSLELGKRLQRIKTALRQRAADLGLPMFASVDFVLESELPRLKRKTA